MIATLTIDEVGEGKKILTYSANEDCKKRFINPAFSVLKVKIINMNNKYTCVLNKMTQLHKQPIQY
jgi:hypothetical protein